MHNLSFKQFSFLLLSFLFLSLIIHHSPATAQAIRDDIPELQQIDVEERLGETIPLDIRFTNHAGEEIPLKKYFNQGKPVALVLAYYECPMLCTLVLNGLTTAAYKTKLKLAEDYQILTVSIDPGETSELAAAKKRAHMKMLEKNPADSGWAFFVGKQDQITQLAEAIGFKYYYDEKRDEYAHPALVTLLTEKGKISRYLYGIEFKPLDLKLGLLEAGEGRVGSSLDKLILYCYHYDPDADGYTVLAGNVMKLGGVATLIILGLFLGVLWLREIRKRKHTDQTQKAGA